MTLCRAIGLSFASGVYLLLWVSGLLLAGALFMIRRTTPDAVARVAEVAVE